LLASPDRIGIFDVKNLRKDGDGRVTPIEIIFVEKPLTITTRVNLRQKALRIKVTQSEYYNFLGTKLAASF
jgi:hypothetical protein